MRGLVGAGEEPVFALYLDNRVYGKLTIVRVNSAHYMEDFVYTKLVSTSFKHVNLDG